MLMHAPQPRNPAPKMMREEFRRPPRANFGPHAGTSSSLNARTLHKIVDPKYRAATPMELAVQLPHQNRMLPLVKALKLEEDAPVRHYKRPYMSTSTAHMHKFKSKPLTAQVYQFE